MNFSKSIFQDRDYFQDITGGIYQVWGSIHHSDAIYALQKYKQITAGENPAKLEQVWVQKSTNAHFKRILSSYSTQNVAKNIEKHPYSRLSSIFNTPMILVPKSAIQNHWKPVERFKQLIDRFTKGSFEIRQNLDALERISIEIGTIILDECKIQQEKIGITGSLLWEGHHAKSDIDLMVYGLDTANQVLNWLKALPIAGNGLRKGNNLELFQLAEALSIKHGSTVDDWFAFLFKKPCLFYYQTTRITINFAPSLSEIPKMPQYDDTAQFINIGPLTLTVTIISSQWAPIYPHLYKIRVDDCYETEIIKSGMQIRLLIFDQDFNGYFQPGIRLFIQGTLQQAKHVLDEENLTFTDKFQITLGLREVKIQEQLRVLIE
jgi:predicted nucleotidyltransferase